ncbi:MAG: hypothetical protein NZM29_05275, partial [Nitrospira sp.]|nr:hypothetical protein [Nitrospira sp.]
GVWAGYTYQWNREQTEAIRVMNGSPADLGDQTWVFPSEAQCMQCHTQAAGFVLGLETAQLNGNYTYPQTGRTANQIVTLRSIDILSPPIGENPPAYVDPLDAAQNLVARARSYLHTNCANCHRPGGPTGVNMDLRYDTPLAQTGTCNVQPLRGDLGIAEARIIAPGDPARSVLLTRMNRRNDPSMMPPLASNVVDTAGVRLIREWINLLTVADCR